MWHDSNNIKKELGKILGYTFIDDCSVKLCIIQAVENILTFSMDQSAYEQSCWSKKAVEWLQLFVQTVDDLKRINLEQVIIRATYLAKNKSFCYGLFI